MELKTLQKELHRLNELVSAWQTAEDITTIERDLVLARLRDVYEALRFGVTCETAEAPIVPPVMSVPEETHEEVLPVEEEPLALEADDFFSFDSILPVEELAEEPATEEVAPEEPHEVEEVKLPVEAEEEQPDEAEEEFAPVEIAVAEEITPVETEIEEEVAPVAEPEPAPEPAPEPVANSFATLFGADPVVDPHRRKQQVIMSLYDAPEVATKPEPKLEPNPEPQVTPTEEEPMVELEELNEEPEELYVTPVQEATEEEDEVIEISEEELERLPEPMPKQKITTDVAHEEDEGVEVLEEPNNEPLAPKTEPESVVLGETIQPKPTLGDQLATQQKVGDLRPRVTDLRRAVGLNDKFLLIRDLFGGNGSLYEITIRKLNEFDNFDDCMIYIAEHFAWNPNSDGAKLMLDLLERKFDQQ